MVGEGEIGDVRWRLDPEGKIDTASRFVCVIGSVTECSASMTKTRRHRCGVEAEASAGGMNPWRLRRAFDGENALRRRSGVPVTSCALNGFLFSG